MRRVLVGVVIGVALSAAAVAGGATVVNWPASCTKMACVNQHLNDVHALAHRADTRALLPGPKGDTGPAGKFTSVEIVTGTFSVPPSGQVQPNFTITCPVGTAIGGGLQEVTTSGGSVPTITSGMTTTSAPHDGTGWSFSVFNNTGNITTYYRDYVECAS